MSHYKLTNRSVAQRYFHSSSYIFHVDGGDGDGSSDTLCPQGFLKLLPGHRWPPGTARAPLCPPPAQHWQQSASRLAPGAAALHAARGRGQLTPRTRPPGLQHRAVPPGSPLPRVSPNSSFSSFPSPRDRNSYTGYRGLEQEPFLPRGRFICHVCNATVLHANSCGVIVFFLFA